jgi:protein subunit release factor A
MNIEVKPGDGGEDAALFAVDLEKAVTAWMSTPYRL